MSPAFFSFEVNYSIEDYFWEKSPQNRHLNKKSGSFRTRPRKGGGELRTRPITYFQNVKPYLKKVFTRTILFYDQGETSAPQVTWPGATAVSRKETKGGDAFSSTPANRSRRSCRKGKKPIRNAYKRRRRKKVLKKGLHTSSFWAEPTKYYYISENGHNTPDIFFRSNPLFLPPPAPEYRDELNMKIFTFGKFVVGSPYFRNIFFTFENKWRFGVEGIFHVDIYIKGRMKLLI